MHLPSRLSSFLLEVDMLDFLLRNEPKGDLDLESFLGFDALFILNNHALGKRCERLIF